MMLLLQVRGNGATNILPPELDNPDSCVSEDLLIMDLDNYLGHQRVIVNHLGIRCWHVSKGMMY